MMQYMTSLMVSKWEELSRAEVVGWVVLILLSIVFFLCLKGMPKAGRTEGDGE